MVNNMVKVNEIKKLRVGKVLLNVDMKKYTTYRAGGKGKILVIPRNVDALTKLMKYIKENEVKYKILGNGSNLVFGDGVYDGVLIKLDELALKT